ncbi:MULTISPECIES: hypothetical protein [unclassified Pseudomonas]|uniref:hypothetical protein n=1 Tax=unclassified Pseudomonas TaxID=196821 RepID=UPI000C86DE01|nr:MULTISPECIES: hypothetical protein [unclassified Pseudomonas]PMV86344.1 hypothetical protein C1X56_15025 [Pseudomonas sp. GW101-1A09]PMV95534.1 hypothetical protein C1X55_21260 [Pseudomonas sp. GW460-C8]PMV97495.1 hypothetical protein C1X51_04515 [Pseudomonas sp. FW306-2-2C-B10A]PMW04846.1 hypothetical protein C1X50_15325 [Pseudomonas sp. MPR-TSA4]PMW13090.1 hypothetical protein C1X52_17895 [Pseudomonas sp. FW306-2-1A-C05A]
MSKNKTPQSTEPTVIDDAHMEQFTNDQLAYKAWIGADLAQEILFDGEACEGSLHDAKFEVAHACVALRVLLRRLTGMDADALRIAVMQVRLEELVLEPDVEQLPAWETMQ